MDPVSAVASVLTLLVAAESSCKFIYEFVHNIVEAPVEIQAHITKLESLDRTLSTLLQIYSSLPHDTPVDTILISRIKDFLGELKIVQQKIGANNSWESLGRGQRIRARCKWLSSDRWLQKFFASLEQWNIIFSQAILAVQTKLLLDIKEQAASLILVQTRPSPNHHISPGSQPQVSNNVPLLQPVAMHRAIVRDSQGSSRSSKRLASYLATVSEPVGYRMGLQYKTTLRTIYLCLRSGQTIVRRWSGDGRETYVTLPASEGYSVCFTLQSRWYWPHKIKLSLHGVYQWFLLPKLRLHLMLQMSAIIPYGSQYWTAARFGDLELLRQVLCLGHHSISDTTVYGDTSLHIATRYENYEVALFLLENGADIDATNDRGETPLHLALKQCNHYKIPQLLLARGADTYRTDIDGRTPFHTFFSDTIRMLIQWHKADIDTTTQDYQGMTIMHYISRSSRSSPDDIAWCLDNTLPPKDGLGRSILHLAAQRGNTILLRYLLSLPEAPKLATPDYMGQTLLHYAAESRRVETIDLLLSAGYGDIYVKDHKGRTPMHHAASRGNVDAVQKLIELGGEDLLKVPDEDRCTPFQVAEAHGVKDRFGMDRALSEKKEGITEKNEKVRLHKMLNTPRAVILLLLMILLWWVFG